jgi:hypothetical protein
MWMVMASRRMPNSEPPFPLGGLISAGFDFYALSWMGMLAGLREPRYVRAVFRTMGAVLVGPWLIVVVFVFMAQRGVSSSAMNSFFCVWYIGAVIYDLGLALWAQGRLMSGFRQLAANDFGPIEGRQPGLLRQTEYLNSPMANG